MLDENNVPVIEKDEQSFRRRRIGALIYYAIISMVWSGLLIYAFVIDAIQIGDVGTWATMLPPIAAIVGLIFAIRKDLVRAIWFFATIWWIGSLAIPITQLEIPRSGLITETVGGLLGLIVIITAAWITVPKDLRNRIIPIAAIVAAAAYLLSSLRPAAPIEQAENLVVATTVINVIMGAIILFIIIYFVRNIPRYFQAFLKSTEGSIVTRLRLNFISISIVPLLLAAVILGVVAFYQARTALVAQEVESLEVIRDNRLSSLTDFIHERETDLQVLADMVDQLDDDAIDLFTNVLQNKQNLLHVFVEGWGADVADVSSDPGVVLGAQNFTAGAEFLGLNYLKAVYGGNPSLDSVGDESLFSAEHAEQHPFFIGYTDIHGYVDAYIISAEGDVVYSAQKANAFGTNLVTGDFSASGLAAVYENLKLSTNANDVYYSDILPFEEEAVAMFVGSPIFDAETGFVGILVYRIDLDDFTSEMQTLSDVGAVTNADIYLVGVGESGVELRTDQQQHHTGKYGDTLRSSSATNAIIGSTGFNFVELVGGDFELEVYAPVNVPGREWGMVISVDLENVFEATTLLKNFQDSFVFYDVFLISPSGEIFYSNEHESDYHTNLLTGPFSDTEFGNMIAGVLVSGEADISDYERYAPSQNTPAQFLAVPIFHADKITMVAAIQINLDEFDQIMTQTKGLGETGETYLVGVDDLFRSTSRYSEDLGVQTTIMDPNFLVQTAGSEAARDGETGSGFIQDYRDVTVLSAWAPLVLDEPDVDDPDGIIWAVLAEIDEAEMLQSVNALALSFAVITTILVAAVGTVAAYIGNRLALGFSQPIVDLTEVTTVFATGDYTARVQVVNENDELGALSTSFNAMAQEIADATAAMEARAEELNTRAQEMEASQRVTFAASERTTPGDFLNLVINLIRDVFDMYHAQVYILTDDKSSVELRESSGYAGRMLLQRGHSIPMERQSLVTTAVKTGEAVLVSETEKDPAWLPNDLLPDTKSELVVPLIQEGVVIGALDIQSRIPGYFSERSVALFQQMTNQIAFLFENASLLDEITTQTESLQQFSEQLRVSAEVAARLNTISNFEDLLDEAVNQLQSRFNFYHAHIYMPDAANEKLVVQAGSGHVGYTLKRSEHSIQADNPTSLVARAARERKVIVVDDVTKLEGYVANPLLPNTHSEVAIPLMLGDKLIGVLDLQDEATSRFSAADVDTLQTLSGQIASSIESAQFFEEVQEAQVRFQTVADYTFDWETWLSEENEYLYCSPSIERITGYTPDELIATPDLFVSMVLEEDKALVEDHVHDHRSVANVDAIEYRILTKDGEERWVRHACQPVFDAQNEWIGRRGSNSDITVQKIAGEQVRESEERLSLMVDQAPIAIIEWNTAFEVVAWNNTAEKIFGFTEAEAIGRHSAGLIVPEEYKVAVEEVWTGLMSQTGGQTSVNDNLTKDGDTITCEWHNTPLVDTNDEVVGVTSMVLDITERTASALEAQRAADRFVALVDNAPDAILTLDAVQREFVDVNQRGLDMFGYTREEFLNLSPADITTVLELDGSNAAEKSMGYVKNAMEGENVSVERRMITKDGKEFIVEFNLIKLPDTENLVRGSLIDITERKAARDTLVQGDRLKSEFLANMSHELRTPLNSIIGYTDVLLMGLDGELDEEVQEDIKAIHDNGQHLLSLINDVLDLAKIEAGRMTLVVEPVDVKVMLSDLHKKNAGLVLNKNVEMKLDVDKGLPNINGDEHRLSQVMTNLISNAVKFTEKGKITLKAFEDKKDVVMQVIDTGIGIGEEDLQAIFEEFTQVDASYSRRAEGTGLGLTITQNLVKMHGGTITVESKLGKGSTFSLRIPVDNVIKPEFTEAVPVKPKANGNKKDAKKKGDTKALV